MAEHPLPTEMFILFGRRVVFAYPMSHLCLLGFTFMFLNVNTLYRFDVFCSLMTGNILDCVLDLQAQEYKIVTFKATVILTHAVGGTFLNCYMLEYFKNRENVFACIMLGLVVSAVLVDVLYEGVRHNHYAVVFLCLICGALAHWSSKLGYVVMLHTGNLFKLSEWLFLFANGYSVGGAKMRGDAIILFFLIVSSLIGALCASMALVYVPRASLVPVLLTVPLHLHLSGCLQVWGWPLLSCTHHCFMSLTRKAPPAAPAVDTGTSSVRNSRAVRESGQSNFDGEERSTQEENSRQTGLARGTLAMRSRMAISTIFERVEISPEELLEFENILGSHNHRAQADNNM